MKKYIAIFCFFLLFANCTEDKEMLEKSLVHGNVLTGLQNQILRINVQIKSNLYLMPIKVMLHFLAQQIKEVFISNKMLTVKPKDKLTFSVKIESVSKDSMLFIMNSAGDIEYLQLIKE